MLSCLIQAACWGSSDNQLHIKLLSFFFLMDGAKNNIFICLSAPYFISSPSNIYLCVLNINVCGRNLVRLKCTNMHCYSWFKKISSLSHVNVMLTNRTRDAKEENHSVSPLHKESSYLQESKKEQFSKLQSFFPTNWFFFLSAFKKSLWESDLWEKGNIFWGNSLSFFPSFWIAKTRSWTKR